MPDPYRHPLQRPFQRRGITLVLTLVLLAVVTLVLGRQALLARIDRTAGLSRTFALESRWMAEGAAQQWLEQGQEPDVAVARLLAAVTWQLGETRVWITPSSTEQKLAVHRVGSDRWLPLVRRECSHLLFAADPDRALLGSSFTALEAVLDSQYLGAHRAYVAPEEDLAPADLLTVWGEGQIDLNRAPRNVLAAALPTLTDAQISKLLRLRTQQPITPQLSLSQELGLTSAQQQAMQEIAAFSPKHFELLIRIQRGQMQSLYRATVSLAENRILELRMIP